MASLSDVVFDASDSDDGPKRPTKFRKLMDKYRRQDPKSGVDTNDDVVDLVSPESKSGCNRTETGKKSDDFKDSTRRQSSPLPVTDDDSVGIPPLPARRVPSPSAPKTSSAALAEDESEAEAAAYTSGEDYGSVDEEETWDDVLARLLARVEPLSARVRSALKAWANGQECDVVPRITESDAASLFPAGYQLKAYQLAGLNWGWLLWNLECNGVLADEMGLGKTIQACALLSFVSKRCGVDGPHLVIAPPSTIANWHRELSRWCPHLRVLSYIGPAKERLAMQRKDISRVADVVLSSYNMFDMESAHADRSFLKRQNWHYLILDEAHSVKNSNTNRHKHLIKVTSRHKLMLTGTPVQNNISELFAMLRFSMPHIFQDEFAALFDDVSNSDASIEHVRNMFEPFVLRRVKQDILTELVLKKHVVEYVAMTDNQQKLYQRVVDSAKRGGVKAPPNDAGNDSIVVLDSSDDDVTSQCTAGIATTPHSVASESVASGEDDVEIVVASGPDVSVPERKVNHLFTELRKACNHPLLCGQRYGKEPEKLKDIGRMLQHAGAFGPDCTLQQVVTELTRMSDFEIHRRCDEYKDCFPSLAKYLLPEDVLFDSGKLRYLQDLIPTLVKKGHRILLFSQWTMILDILETFVHKCLRLTYMRLDGSTKVSERQDMIDEFSEDGSISVFLISTRAGGLGINLTAADTVILHDIDFNPHVDRQAEDRVHRMGQEKPVTVYRLICKGTIDEALMTTQERKAKLEGALLQEVNAKPNRREMAELLAAALKMSAC